MKPDAESPRPRRRRKQVFLILSILVLVSAISFVETQITPFDMELPLSSTILMFILININLLLLLTLLLLVFRKLATLYYEKKRNILGSRLKTRLITSFIIVALLPTTVLFFFSIQFISTSIAYWFNAPIEESLNRSLSVGRTLYDHIEARHLRLARHAGNLIELRHPPDTGNPERDTTVRQILQESGCTGIELYTPDARRISQATDPDSGYPELPLLTPEDLTALTPVSPAVTLHHPLDSGELIRTLVLLPRDAKPEDDRTILVITTRLDGALSEDLAAIRKGVAEYHQLKLTKEPAQISYYIALFIVALLVIFCAIWFGFQMARSITVPILKFAEATQRISNGDLNYRIDFATDDEIGTLITSFNSMTEQLAAGREQIARSGELLKAQNAELEKSRRYMEIILRNIAAGVVSLDHTGAITTINKSAESMLAIQGRDIMGRHFSDIVPSEYQPVAHKIYDLAAGGQKYIEMPVNATISGTPRHFSLHYTSLTDDAGQNMGAVLVFDDITALEKAQRMAAWREVARRIAHEVKNPLTPIKLSAQRLKRKYGRQINDDIFISCADTIVEHVDLIRNLVNQFSTFAKFPDVILTRARIENIILETIALYREGLENVTFTYRFGDNIPALNLDHQHMKQAFINLIDNAVAAMRSNGTLSVDVSWDPILKIVRIEIADTGTGISDKDKTRLFEPYFSTKKSSMGLGLAIVHSIISDHNGVIRVQDNLPRGARFIIEIPDESPPERPRNIKGIT